MGSVAANRVGKCGRKRKTTPKNDELLIRISKINPRKSAVDLTRELHEDGINLHVERQPHQKRAADSGHDEKEISKNGKNTPRLDCGGLEKGTLF
ncbi:unnamed protein product [Parnassius apollo]|uniref:(apollo) hypothetical protein n=1 Tax=Parnassius apollo TaxID=110799 RepID=A0A8S3W517_PARAO|nr:unnamed protein product [Parnassius apollo]